MTIDDEIIDDLLSRYEGGLPLRAVCQKDDMPDIVVLQEYMRRNPVAMDRLRASKAKAKQQIADDASFRKQARVNRKEYIEGMKHGRKQ